MKVGLLICGEMPPAMHRNGKTYPRLLKKWLDGHMPGKSKYETFRAFAGSLPPRVDSRDCYFVSGSPASLGDKEPWMKQLCNFLLVAAKAQVPVVGIGFGHQVLAQALGGRVASAKNWEVGLKQWKVVREEGWMRDCGKRLSLLTFNRDQVVKLPPRSVRVASSESCPNGVFRIANHTIGVQGHPEFDNKVLRQLIKSRADELGPKICEKALEDLDGETQANDMARWCAGFVSTRA